MPELTLAITCGGTGGHFYPGLSVARVLQKRGGRALLLLSGTNAARQKSIAASFGVPAVALPRMPSPRGIGTLFEFGCGALGGLPWRRGASFARCGRRRCSAWAPSHRCRRFWRRAGAESRYSCMTATRGSARRTAFSAGTRSCWPRRFQRAMRKNAAASCWSPACPLRPELEQAAGITRAEAIAGLNREFGVELDTAIPTLLIFGGSQGASIFNETVPKALRKLQEKTEFQVLHLAGPKKLAEVRDAYGDVVFPSLLLESSEKMELFLGAADLVFSRSGGSTVAELARFGKASVLIPYPYAAENHQYDNARVLAGHGAAELLPNAECTPERIERLLAGSSRSRSG